MGDVTLEEVNQFDREKFVEVLGRIYEKSAWVAEQTWSDRPFGSVEELHGAMRQTVDQSSRDAKLELLRAHPDLGEQTDMTDASEEEQASAGLDELHPEQYEAFQRLNERYREKFGFPFIMAVKDETPDAIQAAMEERVEQTRSVEFDTALEQVHKIARFRLVELPPRDSA